MVVSPISALLLVSVAALVSGAEENGTPLERYDQALNQPGSSFSSVIVDRPSSYDQALKQPVDLLRGKKPNCKTQKACTNAGGECTKKKKCNGRFKRVKKGCSKGCVCCIPDTKCQCGVANTQRIIGGKEVTPKRKYPWQVGLVDLIFIKCGGTIINDRWILTAAHCIVDRNTCRIKYDSSSSLRVWVGEHNQLESSDDVSDTRSYSIKTYVKHPKYRCDNLDYDLALLELTEAIPFNNVIRPVCLPKDDSKTYVGKTGIVTGWGNTDNPKYLPTYLREVQIPIVANNKCGKWPSLAAIKMCAGVGKGICHGDSGGPMHVVENNKYVQVGVVSYVSKEYGCKAKDWPGVYARVSKVLPWIHRNTANGNKCN